MIKKHLPLIVAIALPIVFIGILALAILVPSMRISPQHDFIYVNLQESSMKSQAYPYVYTQYRNEYVIENGTLTKKPLNIFNQAEQDFTNPRIPGSEIEYVDAPKLYRYSPVNSTSYEITFEEAKQLSLVPGPASPDGYTVEYEYNSDGIFELFGSDNDSGYVITKGAARKTLTGIPNDNNYYGDNISIIGWVN